MSPHKFNFKKFRNKWSFLRFSDFFFLKRELKTDSLSLLTSRAQVTVSLTAHPVYTGRVMIIHLLCSVSLSLSEWMFFLSKQSCQCAYVCVCASSCVTHHGSNRHISAYILMCLESSFQLSTESHRSLQIVCEREEKQQHVFYKNMLRTFRSHIQRYSRM